MFLLCAHLYSGDDHCGSSEVRERAGTSPLICSGISVRVRAGPLSKSAGHQTCLASRAFDCEKVSGRLMGVAGLFGLHYGNQSTVVFLFSRLFWYERDICVYIYIFMSLGRQTGMQTEFCFLSAGGRVGAGLELNTTCRKVFSIFGVETSPHCLNFHVLPNKASLKIWT